MGVLGAITDVLQRGGLLELRGAILLRAPYGCSKLSGGRIRAG